MRKFQFSKPKNQLRRNRVRIRIALVSFLVLGVLFALFGPELSAEEGIYFARCNLKVLEGNEITWINWQAAPTFIPVNTKLKVTRNGSKATLVNAESGGSYTLDIGADGESFLEKFVSKSPVDIKDFSEGVQANIKDAVARVGMTKEQVFIAMGPPTNIGKERTNLKTYKEIMGSDLWIYARRRFGKNIGVGFDPATGKANRTEGIWR
jgi:hypothetical protein